jgi:predicted acetyltransferase
LNFRKYHPGKDKKAVLRIWQECGWIGDVIDKDKSKIVEKYIKASDAYVSEIDGSAECLVLTMPGSYRYLNSDIDFCAVTVVATSLVARKKAMATKLNALTLASTATGSNALAGLGVFDQGFYDKLGFGTGPYEHWVNFDPSTLRVKASEKLPDRLTIKDFKMIHQSRLARMRKHGSVNILPPEHTLAEISEKRNSFGLGYIDKKSGRLTHHLWLSSEGEQGPCTVWWMAYQNYSQLVELLSILKAFNDQIISVELREPPDIQIQDLLSRPFRYRTQTKKSKHENRMSSMAYYQLRILNLKDCISRTCLDIDKEIRLNLVLHDPINDYLQEKNKWRGIGGKYILILGKESTIVDGQDKVLPTLQASTGAFTRMWLGVRPATALAVTDELSGPQDLLNELDRAFRLPAPKADWDF